MKNKEDIGSHYSKYFQIVNANTEELRKIAYKLRHEVYIEEFGYHEFDEYDEYSLHCLLFHKPSNQAIGYIRLIPQIEKLNNQLPIEKFYGKPFDFNTARVNMAEKTNIGEVSRMAIMPSFRRRLSDNNDRESFKQSEKIAHPDNRYPINYLPMCLVSAAMHFAFARNIEYCLAMVEPKLAILLRRLGVQFDQIGQPFEFFGTRVPHVFYPEITYKNLTPEFRSLSDKISSELSEQNVIENIAYINAR
ncbi:PEP-CTERM/exosortase system-associated acyltransferase [Methylobacter sp. BlB1]|uniref:PEP-CTERM/exosortase system-associated acyltransferase n=1 Tax=Methylobacter sp. BlB1 TaxID=2785914 RepID=UPI0018942159|nr:PEP-CTERM/exosortase system-associated acyltransferase [Methylobacter sp. BlB1]MBF6647672.1 PEP-CTERM/exosortase system-associated acyltransferase [Methylobacter sp. BlB1]